MSITRAISKFHTQNVYRQKLQQRQQTRLQVLKHLELISDAVRERIMTGEIPTQSQPPIDQTTNDKKIAAIAHHLKPSAKSSLRSSYQSGPAVSSDSRYTKLHKQDGLNGTQAFCEGLSSPATSLNQSTEESSTMDSVIRGSHQFSLVVKEAQLAAPISTHDRPLTAENVANVAIGPSSLDIYMRVEDRFERCLLGLPGERAEDSILDPKLAQVLETL